MHCNNGSVGLIQYLTHTFRFTKDSISLLKPGHLALRALAQHLVMPGCSVSVI